MMRDSQSHPIFGDQVANTEFCVDVIAYSQAIVSLKYSHTNSCGADVDRKEIELS